MQNLFTRTPLARIQSTMTPWLWALIGWTLFLWLSRLRNVANNDELSASGQVVRIGVVVVFLALAAGAAIGMRRGRLMPAVVFVTWTIGYWLVRGTGILIDGEYSIGFKVVHTVLMLVSLSLSALTARQLRLSR